MTEAPREPDDHDGWAPLPAPTLSSEPARSAKPVPVLPRPAIEPVSATKALRNALGETIDAAAQERALRELQQRLHERPRERDPVHAAFVHPTRRATTTGDDTAPEARPDPRAASIDGSRDASQSIAFADGHDAREDQAWFQQLPEDERERLREEWRWQRERFDELPKKKWRDVRLAAMQGAFVFFCVALLTTMASGYGGATGWLVLAGAAAAALARAANGGRFVFAIAGALAYAAAMRGTLLQSTLLWYVWSAAAFGLGLLGLDREMRQSGGFSGVLRVTKKPTAPATAQGNQIQTASDASTRSPHDEKNARTPSGATSMGRNAKNSRS